MPTGLQVWDESGREILSPNDGAIRVIGVIQNITEGQSSRTITNDIFTQGQIFFSAFRISGIGTDPKITFSGNQMTYTPGVRALGTQQLKHFLIYGVYS